MVLVVIDCRIPTTEAVCPVPVFVEVVVMFLIVLPVQELIPVR